MSQNFFQIIRPVHVHLKTDKVDLKKRPPWKKKFLHFFSINSSSRHEKCCQMLQRLFWLFQCSKNPLCMSLSLIFMVHILFTTVSCFLAYLFSLLVSKEWLINGGSVFSEFFWCFFITIVLSGFSFVFFTSCFFFCFSTVTIHPHKMNDLWPAPVS